MTEQTPKAKITAGVDVSKKQLDAYSSASGVWRKFSNDAKGVKELAKFLKAEGVTACVVEATSKYHFEAWFALHSKGIPVCVVQPMQPKAFAQSRLQHAKTDEIDAKLLAEFGAAVELRQSFPQRETIRKLRDLRSLRGSLLKSRNAIDNLSSGLEKGVKRHSSKTTKFLDAQIKEVEAQIDALFEGEPDLKRNRELLLTVPGVGGHTSRNVLTDFEEIGMLTNKQIASLAGLAPHPRDSGKKKGKRSIRGGRAEGRTGFYMATVRATRCNPVIKAFYNKLIARNKPFKVAITACMRKLLTIMNAMIRDQKPWDPKLSAELLVA